MANFLKKILIIPLSGAFLAGAFLPFNFVSAAAYFNGDSQDYPTLEVSNYTKYPNSDINWSSSVYADANDVISFEIYYHNTSGSETANQTRVKVNLPSGNFTSGSATANLWAQNAGNVTGNSWLNLSSSQTLTFVPGSVKWYPNRSDNPVVLPSGQDGSEIVSSSGLNIGDIAPGWETQGYVVFHARVSNNNPPPPPPPPPSQGSAPTIYTNYASSIYQSSATLNASVNPNSSNTTVWFEYGQTPSFGNTTGYQSVGSGNYSTNFSGYLSGMSSNSVYYFRAVAQNSYGTTYGNTLSFTTAANYYNYNNYNNNYGYAPYVYTNSATSIGNNFAVLNGTVNPNNSSADVWFEYGTTMSFGSMTNVQYTGSGSSQNSFSYTVTNLQPGISYYFRAVARNSYGTNYGNVFTFITASGASVSPSGNLPLVTTKAATYVYRNSALLNGSVNPNNGMTNAWFEWGETANFGNTTPLQPMGSDARLLNYAFVLSGLKANNVYYFRAAAQNSFGIQRGSVLSFTTQGGGQPIILGEPVVVVENPTTGEIAVRVLPSVDFQEPKQGDEINITVVYKNEGKIPARDAVLKAILPAEVEYRNADFLPSSREDNKLTFTIGNLGANSQGAVNIRVKTSENLPSDSVLVFNFILEYKDSKNVLQSASSFLSITAKKAKELQLAAIITAMLKSAWFWVLFAIAAVSLAAAYFYYAFVLKKRREEEAKTG